MGYPGPTVCSIFVSVLHGSTKEDHKDTMDMVAFAKIVVHLAHMHREKGYLADDHLF